MGLLGILLRFSEKPWTERSEIRGSGSKALQKGSLRQNVVRDDTRVEE